MRGVYINIFLFGNKKKCFNHVSEFFGPLYLHSYLKALFPLLSLAQLSHNNYKIGLATDDDPSRLCLKRRFISAGLVSR